MQMPSSVMNKINNSLSNQVGGNYLGVIIIGALSALMVTACVAPPLVATLMVIGESGNIARGIIALSSLSLGLGIPLIIIGLTAGQWLPKSGAYLENIKNLFGFIMFALAIWVLNPLLSEEIINLLWGVILIAAAIYFLWPLSKKPYKKSFKYPKLYACLASIILGLFIVSDQSEKIILMKDQKSLVGVSDSLFDPIGSLIELDNSLELASKNGNISLLYITADWCISCKRLERETFSNPDMIKLLSSINSIKADVSKNSENDIELMKQLSIFGPPTLIVYDQNGNEKENIRKIGVVNAKELINDIKTIQ
jgi:thiol:disulfide interchange protein DsbD